MEIRLDSYLSQNGVTSRRNAKELITTGRVTVDQRVVTEVIKIDTEKNTVTVDGKETLVKNNHMYLMLNKPLDVLSSVSDDRGRKTVLDIVDVPERIYPVGRLDYNSTGLLLLTNDGDFTLHMTHPKYHVPKKYVVTTKENNTEKQLSDLRQGVTIYNTTTLPAKVRKLSRNTFEITIHQGMKRQVREMCRAVGLSVIFLERIQIGKLKLGSLKQGDYRQLTQEEVAGLMQYVEKAPKS